MIQRHGRPQSLHDDPHRRAGPDREITLNRPDKRNPIGPATCGELVHALTRFKAMREVRVIGVTGAGPAFSAGGDLGDADAAAEACPASLVELFVAMHSLGKPIIAMVNGMRSPAGSA
jgi:enoyl-CoA hydratase/carnithine racemase